MSEEIPRRITQRSFGLWPEIYQHRQQVFSGIAMLMGKQSRAEIDHHLLWERLIEGTFMFMNEDHEKFAQIYGNGAGDAADKAALARFLKWVKR